MPRPPFNSRYGLHISPRDRSCQGRVRPNYDHRIHAEQLVFFVPDTSSQYITMPSQMTMPQRTAQIKYQVAETPDPTKMEQKALRAVVPKSCQVLNARNSSRRRKRNNGAKTRADGSRKSKTRWISAGKLLAVDCATLVPSVYYAHASAECITDICLIAVDSPTTFPSISQPNQGTSNSLLSPT